MFIEEFVEKFAERISTDEQIPLDEARKEARKFVKVFLKATIENLEVGEKIEYLVPAEPPRGIRKCLSFFIGTPYKTKRRFIKRESETELVFGQY